jgi:hypothetical protein
MSESAPDGSAEEHSVGETTDQQAARTAGVQDGLQKDTAASKDQSSQEPQPLDAQKRPTPSPRRQLPSGLSASISPESLAGSLDGGAQLREDGAAEPAPGALPAGADTMLQSGPAAAAAYSTTVGGGDSQKSAATSGGQSVRPEVNRQSQTGPARSVREPVAEYQAAAPRVLTAGAPAPANRRSDQTVAGAVPDLAHMAVPYQGNTRGIRTFIHAQPAGPLNGMRENLALQNPGRRGDPHGTTLLNAPAKRQLLGERLDGPPDPRALNTIMSARLGQAPASNGWGGGNFMVPSGSTPVSKSCGGVLPLLMTAWLTELVSPLLLPLRCIISHLWLVLTVYPSRSARPLSLATLANSIHLNP